MEKAPTSCWHKPRAWMTLRHRVPPSAIHHIPWQRRIARCFSARNLSLLQCLPPPREPCHAGRIRQALESGARTPGKEGRTLGCPWPRAEKGSALGLQTHEVFKHRKHLLQKYHHGFRLEGNDSKPQLKRKLE